MTKPEVRAFFIPYLRAEYPACSDSATAPCGQGDPESTLFVGLTGLRAWANPLDKPTLLLQVLGYFARVKYDTSVEVSEGNDK